MPRPKIENRSAECARANDVADRRSLSRARVVANVSFFASRRASIDRFGLNYNLHTQQAKIQQQRLTSENKRLKAPIARSARQRAQLFGRRVLDDRLRVFAIGDMRADSKYIYIGANWPAQLQVFWPRHSTARIRLLTKGATTKINEAKL